MAIPLKQIRGMTDELAAKLRALGIRNSDALLAAARTPADRRALASKLGVDVRVVTELANRADLARIRGVAGVYADLLEAAGVDTVKELARRNPANLHEAILRVNAERKLARRPPALSQVESWVEQAKGLPPALEY